MTQTLLCQPYAGLHQAKLFRSRLISQTQVPTLAETAAFAIVGIETRQDFERFLTLLNARTSVEVA